MSRSPSVVIGRSAGPAAAEPGEVARQDRRWAAAFILGSGALCALIFWLAHSALIDDAYITLAYAKNVALNLHWGLTPQQVSNTATSPGNVLLIAGATMGLKLFGGIHPVLGLGVVSVGCGLAFGWGWARIVHRLVLPWGVGMLGVVLVLLNPYLLSAIGLEVLPIAAVLALLLAAALDERSVLFGALSGLALLIRLDLVIFLVLLAVLTPGLRRRVLLIAPIAVLIGAPWYIWSWFYFGSAVPDTFVIKTLQQSFGGVSFASGPIAMFHDKPLLIVVAFLPLLAGTVMLTGWAIAAASRRSVRLRGLVPVAALGMGGVVYYGVYSNLHVPPYHWYYVSPIVALTITATVIAGRLMARTGHRSDRVTAVVIGAGFAAVALVTVGLVAGQGAPWTTTLIFGNWATSTDYARVGTQIGDRVGDSVVHNPGEIGTMAYFCGCAMVNDFTDRGVLVPLVEKRIEQSGAVGAWLLRLNYRNLDRSRTPLPASYELHYDLGPGTGPDVWEVSAPGRGVGHLSLIPVR